MFLHQVVRHAPSNCAIRNLQRQTSRFVFYDTMNAILALRGWSGMRDGGLRNPRCRIWSQFAAWLVRVFAQLSKLLSYLRYYPTLSRAHNAAILSFLRNVSAHRA